MTKLSCAAAFALALLTIQPAMAQTGKVAPKDWPAEKCRRYGAAYEATLAKRGQAGLSEDFLKRHAAFMASGCTARGDVCARSREELDLANTMVLHAMNAGMASTFPPFYCR